MALASMRRSTAMASASRVCSSTTLVTLRSVEVEHARRWRLVDQDFVRTPNFAPDGCRRPAETPAGTAVGWSLLARRKPGVQIPSPPPQPRRRERRQRRAGDAHCMLRPCGGRTLKSQFSREGLQRPSGSALGHIDHAAWSPASCLSWSATWSTWPHCQPLPTTTTIQVDSPLAQHGLRQLRGPGSNLRQRRAVVDNASHPRRRG
jgi:hypothetical protein